MVSNDTFFSPSVFHFFPTKGAFFSDPPIFFPTHRAFFTQKRSQRFAKFPVFVPSSNPAPQPLPTRPARPGPEPPTPPHPNKNHHTVTTPPAPSHPVSWQRFLATKIASDPLPSCLLRRCTRLPCCSTLRGCLQNTHSDALIRWILAKAGSLLIKVLVVTYGRVLQAYKACFLSGF